MSDADEGNQALRMLLVFGVLFVLLAIAGYMLWPLAAEFGSSQLAPGLGMRDAAVISFFVTVLTMVVFAFAAGDGFIGEIQFMLAGFFSFFVVIWLMLAWIF